MYDTEGDLVIHARDFLSQTAPGFFGEASQAAAMPNAASTPVCPKLIKLVRNYGTFNMKLSYV